MSIVNQVQSGDVLAFRGTSLMSELIQHVEGGAYSHVALAFQQPDGLYVLEAREFIGIRKIIASKYLPVYHVDLIATGCKWTPQVEALALSIIGKEYSYLAAIEVGLGFSPDQSAEICSLYCQQVLTKAGFVIPRRGMTPQALIDDLIEQGATISKFSI
eukprot:gene11885-11977_t